MNHQKLLTALRAQGFAPDRARELANWWCYAPPGTPYPSSKPRPQSSKLQAQSSSYPGWRFTRVSPRRVPRTDWPQRWAAAGAACGFEGASRTSFVALKDSPIWAALGSGAGGFSDATGSDVPPFAYGSGMGWVRASRAECIKLGLIKGEKR